ncbi:unnamed protein product [Protopolystoma xenopodis]|uniref:Uncharacterized protein n=1 Tax=Protopolystoma xenopodis TaxID=117903 RepID=A0A448XM90_9PLAT|nr:unnamed protein product [Protopolystoma xenopodis]
MTRLTENADYGAGEMSGNVSRPLSDFGNDYAYAGLRTSIESCSGDACHNTDESLAQFHRGSSTLSRGLLLPIQQSSLRINSPSVSSETTSPIPSNQF